MKQQLKHCILVLPLLLLLALPVHGQNLASQPGAFLRVGVGARALAMGGAYTGIAQTPAAAYWNPAGLSQMKTVHFTADYANMTLDRTYNYAAGVLPTWGFGALAVSWMNFGVENIEGRSGNSSDPDFVFGGTESALMVSYSLRIASFLSVGANYKFLQHQLYTADATGSGFDAGLLLRPVENFSIGLMVQDINSAINWSNGLQEEIPLVTRLGFGLNADQNFQFGMDMIFAGGKFVNATLGTEYRPIKALPMRMGYSSKGLVLGTGLEIPMNSVNLQLDYGYGEDALGGGDAHKFTMGIAFASRKPAPTADEPELRRKPVTRQLHYVVIEANRLNVRQGPNVKYKRIAIVKKGQRFRKAAVEGEWCKIQIGKNRYGWIHRKFVKEMTKTY